MNEAIQKARIYYKQMKQKGERNHNGPLKKGQKSFMNSGSVKIVGGRHVHRKE